MNRKEALDFLWSRINYETQVAIPYTQRHFKLARMHRLLERIGSPQTSLAIVHVAGTKGKGSTCAFISQIALEAGLKVGLYSSPHLERVEERIRINGEECSPDAFVELVAELQPAIQTLDQDPAFDSGPTFFEIMTAMALLHFRQQQVDLALLEVGLGGRLDSTNVCVPRVCVITSISYDHMQQLGNRLEQIAAEKAGIIKAGIPVVSGVLESPAREVIVEKARQMESPLWLLGEDFSYQSESAGIVYRFRQESPLVGPSPLRPALLGGHQAHNAALAIAAIEVLRQQGMPFTAQAVAAGVSNTRCPARCEVIRQAPLLVLDSAHNVASIEALLETLRRIAPPGKKRLVFAVSRDKDAAGMLRRLLSFFDDIFLTHYASNPRYLDPGHLLASLGFRAADSTRIHIIDQPRDAVRLAAPRTPDEMLVVTGSFFLAGEVRDRLIALSLEADSLAEDAPLGG